MTDTLAVPQSRQALAVGASVPTAYVFSAFPGVTIIPPGLYVCDVPIPQPQGFQSPWVRQDASVMESIVAMNELYPVEACSELL